MSKTVAAVMPTRNQAEFLRAALDSVVKQVDWLVVVNDQSTDDTPRVLDSFCNSFDTIDCRNVAVLNPVKWLRTHDAINLGIQWLWDYEARNGVSFDWLTWVSSDNTCEPNWRDELLSAAGPKTGVVYSAYYRVRPNGKTSVFNRPYDPKRLIADENCFFGPSFIIRNDVWREVGEHRGAISHDYDHWLRVEEVCWRRGLDIVHVPKPICRYNVHGKRRTVTEKNTYDATEWRLEARKRRGLDK